MSVLSSFVRSLRTILSVALLGTLVASSALAVERFVFEHEFVLGTNLQVQIDASSQQAAEAAETRLLDEIRRLEAIYSGYSSDSEFSKFEASSQQALPVSEELFHVLSACDRWRSLSHGAFNPAVMSASELWMQAGRTNQAPSKADLAAAAQRIQQSQWMLDETSRTATRLTDGQLSIDAIAKGIILDRAADAVLADRDQIQGVIVNIGGDLRIAGESVAPVLITDPLNTAVNARPLASIHARNRGVATSGGYHRGFDVNGEHYSHIIDPRTAEPVDRFASVTVVAENAETADALSTTFSVLSAEECAAIAETMPGLDYLLVTKDGRQISSPGWEDLQQPQLFRYVVAAETSGERKETASGSSDGLLELVVNFELAQPTGAQYRRPYLAIWLEDADGFPVRTAVLWMMTKQPGPRWHRDLLKWYRNDRTRKLADQRDLIGVVSEATRGPGKYKAIFDGKDDSGAALPPGKYTLHIEAAREHGTYQLISHPLELGAEPIAEVPLKSNVEIKSASVEYRQPAGAGN